MKLFGYRYRWYTWISKFNRLSRFLILFLPSIVLVVAWYFLLCKPIQAKIAACVKQAQNINKERATFYELNNQVVELQKELDLFLHESARPELNSFGHEKIFDLLHQEGIFVTEFEQESLGKNLEKPISIRMKLTSEPLLLLNFFYLLKAQPIFFILKSFELAISNNQKDWTMSVLGQVLV